MKIITILRKPLDKTIVNNVLTHGCGGINIDDCRVGDVVQDTSKNGRSSDSHKNSVYQSGLKDNVDGRITVGRWPSNFALIHLEGCELKGTKKVKAPKHRNPNTKVSPFCHTEQKKNRPDRKKYNRTDKEGNENVSNWDCVEGCPVKKLDLDSSEASRFFKQFKKGSSYD